MGLTLDLGALDIVNAHVCDSNLHWERDFPGSNGETYTVRWEKMPPTSPYEYAWTCTCKFFQFHPGAECKHIRKAKPQRCAWGEGAFSGSFSEPAHDGTCPQCGGSTTIVRVRV